MTTASALLPLPTENVLIPACEISQYTGIARQTHNRYRHEGIGPQYVKLGHRVFYRSDDIRRWIDSNCHFDNGEQPVDPELQRLDHKLHIDQFRQS